MNSKIKATAILVISVAAIGCVSSKCPSTDLHLIRDPVSDSATRLVFFRTKDSKLYILRSATVSVDGAAVRKTPYGGYNILEVEPGTRKLKASMWDSPGTCTLELKASPGQTYYFQVDPRVESFGAFSAGDTIMSVLVDNPIISVIGGVIASSAESYGRECGGAFRLYPVDTATAEMKITSLSYSD